MVQLVQAFSPSPMPTPPQMAHSCIGILRQGAGERAGPDQQVKPARRLQECHRRSDWFFTPR